MSETKWHSSTTTFDMMIGAHVSWILVHVRCSRINRLTMLIRFTYIVSTFFHIRYCVGSFNQISVALARINTPNSCSKNFVAKYLWYQKCRLNWNNEVQSSNTFTTSYNERNDVVVMTLNSTLFTRPTWW